MPRQVLFISGARGFTVNAIMKDLTSEGYDVQFAQPDIVAVTDLHGYTPEAYVFYIDTDLSTIAPAVLDLAQKVVASRVKTNLYLIGSDEDIEKAKAMLPEGLGVYTFKKPLDVKLLIAAINRNMTDIALNRDHKSILLVDDDPTLLHAMNSWLSEKYTVFMANSGMNAISFLSRTSVDLILLDYEMPVVSGLQVFEMLKGEPSTKDIPVIFLTGKNDKNTIVKVLAAKPERYLLKSLPPKDLLKSIDEFFMWNNL